MPTQTTSFPYRRRTPTLTRALLLATLLPFLVITPSSADEIFLADGSKIICQIQRLDAGKLIVKTDFADQITIDASKIKGLSTDSPIYLQLDSGDRVMGQVTYTHNSRLQLKRESPSGPAIDFASVKALWPIDKDSPEVAAAKAEYQAARSKWSIRVELGLDGATGNTERIAANGNLQATLTADQNRLNLYAKGRFTSENGKETVREIIGGANLESDLNDGLFLFAKTEFENDKFEDLDLRATISAGLGYFLIKQPDTELKIRGGPGYQHESFTSGGTQDAALAEAGWDFKHKIAPRLLFTHNTNLTVPVTNSAHWRAVIENAAEIPLTPKQDWKIRLGVKNQYDAQPQPTVENLDTNYFLNLVWDFL